MDSKLNSMVIASIPAFILFAGVTTSFVSVLAQGEGGDTGGMPGGEGMTGGGGMSANTSEMSGDEGITVGGGMTKGLGNETGGMTEGQTDPNGEGEVDLGTGGP
jgi:hypothetical protein